MTAALPASWPPLMLTVAPNGAFKTEADHPALPLTPRTLAQTAKACLDVGASMIHLHVRDVQGRHLLDAQAYQEATAAIRQAVGQELVVQITSEAGKRYGPAEQMAVIRGVRPEAVSVALRELMPDEASEKTSAPFFEWLGQERIMTQVILYAPEELHRYRELCRRGVLPQAPRQLLFVLGRYSRDQQSDPQDLLPFLQALDHEPAHWSVCAFGLKEAACLMAAITFSGHARTGFENNLFLPDGQRARDNAELVQLMASLSRRLNRPLASAADVRAWFAQRILS